jgi:hypothetical protein
MEHNISTVVLPDLFCEEDYLKLCEKWKADVSDVDPVSLEAIPAEYLIRFRMKTRDTETVLISRDVRTLKELLERNKYEGVQFIDPVVRIPYSEINVKKINSHPYCRQFNIVEFKNKLDQERNNNQRQEEANNLQAAMRLDEQQVNNNDNNSRNNNSNIIDSNVRVIDVTRQLKLEAGIPRDINQIFIRDLPPTRIIKEVYDRECAGIIDRSLDSLCNRAILAVKLQYIDGLKQIYELLKRKGWNFTRNQLDILEYVGWQDSFNPPLMVEFLRSNRPWIYRTGQPNPVAAFRKYGLI